MQKKCVLRLFTAGPLSLQGAAGSFAQLSGVFSESQCLSGDRRCNFVEPLINEDESELWKIFCFSEA